MIYFDHAASSPLREEALSELSKALREGFANPSSAHALGRNLAREIDTLSREFLEALSLSPNEYKVIWTSSATESNNLALKGLAHQYVNRGKKIITTLGEHESVLEPALALQREDYEVLFLPLLENGSVDLKALEASLDKETILLSLIATNNETGAINDLAKARSMIKPYPKVLFHSDLTQGLLKGDFPLNVLDCLSFSAHKFGGPKGVGGLIAKKKLSFLPLLDGGGQMDGLRSGTINYPGIRGTVAALLASKKKEKEERSRIEAIRDHLYKELSKNPEILINSPLDGSPYILNFSLKTKRASVLLEALSHEGIYVSSLSACSSKTDTYSKVLEATYHDLARASNAIRLSFGPENTLEEADVFLQTLTQILERIIHR